jgi:environmental stress-induced protein Ves
VVVPWANGLGTTSVVARWPDDDQWAWRLSLADVVVDGPFSMLPGVDRFIAVASGVGMELTIGDRPPVRLTPDSPSFAFDGDAETRCELIDGPIVDVNLMVRRGSATGSLDLIRLGVGDEVDVSTACVVLDGSVGLGDQVAGRFDAIDESCRVIALEHTRVALVTVRDER